MGTFGDSFVNMADRPRRWTNILAGVDGATLYFPPGTHTVPDATLLSSGRLIFPDKFVLEFAHGAALTPVRESGDEIEIEIQGEIRAGRHRIFEAPPGAIRLTWRLLREVLPEWWGAREFERLFAPVLSARLATEALRAAIQAAWTDRWTRNLPPVPISLAGTYLLDGTLEVRGPAEASTGSGPSAAHEGPRFILHGEVAGSSTGGFSARTGVGNTTTLRAAESFSGSALLSLVDVPRFELVRLQLDGADRALTDLEIRPPAIPAVYLVDIAIPPSVQGVAKPFATSLQEYNKRVRDHFRDMVPPTPRSLPRDNPTAPVSMTGLIRECTFTGAVHTLVRVERYVTHPASDETWERSGRTVLSSPVNVGSAG